MSPRFLWSTIMARKLDWILMIVVAAVGGEGNPPSGASSKIIEEKLLVAVRMNLAPCKQQAPGLRMG